MTIRLIREDATLLEALVSTEAFWERYGADLTGQLEVARQVVRQTLDFERRVTPELPWVGYLAVDMDSNTVIGSCGFKGNPTPNGSVEIAYFTFPRFEGQGHATAMALRLVALARETGKVARVVAHTLPERNASTRVLEKAGFEHAGDVTDPEDGRVWQWRREL